MTRMPRSSRWLIAATLAILTSGSMAVAQTVASVKAGGALPTVRQFERWLTRDARLSRREAKVVITKGFASLLGARDAAGEPGADLAATIRRAARMISTRNDEHDRHA